MLEEDGSEADGLNARKDAFLAGMEEKVRAGTGNYFLPGGIWAEEKCFRAIAEEQEFYLDGEGRWVSPLPSMRWPRGVGVRPSSSFLPRRWMAFWPSRRFCSEEVSVC